MLLALLPRCNSMLKCTVPPWLFLGFKIFSSIYFFTISQIDDFTPWASQLLPSLLAIKANQVPNLPPNKKMTLRFYVLSCFLLTALFPSVQTSLPMASLWCDGATTPVVMCNQLAVAWPRSSPWLSQLPTCRFSEPPHVILPGFLRMRFVIENKGPVFHKSSTSNQASKCHIFWGPNGFGKRYTICE